MFLVWILPGGHLQSGPTASRSQLVSQKSALERKLKALEIFTCLVRDDAEDAIDSMDGRTFEGRELRVQLAK